MDSKFLKGLSVGVVLLILGAGYHFKTVKAATKLEQQVEVPEVKTPVTTTETIAPAPTNVPPKVKNIGTPYEISFNKREHDYGKIKKGSDGAVYFKFTNVGNDVVSITGSTAFCGCTVPEWKPKRLNKGESDSIKVIYDTKRIGYFNKVVHINFNKNSKPEVLTLKGHVIEK